MMETEPISADDWELVAKQTLIQYYNRGGHGNGDSFQLLEGANFINTIGYAMSLVPNIGNLLEFLCAPSLSDISSTLGTMFVRLQSRKKLKNWSSDHFKLARDGALYYYEGKNLEAIEHIVKKLQAEANGSREVFVSILPVSFFFTNSLFTLPLFRYKVSHDEKEERFMDHTGRVYQTFEDWKVNNILPATQIFYPRDGHLKLKQNEEAKPDCVLEDSAECSRPVKTLLACDIASGTLGLAAGIGLTMVTGGAALLMMGGMALSASYGAGRAGFRLRDRAKHSETINPFKSREAFWVWLGLGADVVTFGTIGAASTQILSTITQSAAFLDISKKFAAATRVMSIFSGAARPMTDSAKALLTGYEIFIKLRNKSTDSILKLPKSTLMHLNDSIEEFSESNMLMMAITEGFWSKSKMTYVSPEEFQDMVHETIIAHMADQCCDHDLFESSMSMVQHDVAIIEAYKHLDEDMGLEELMQIINDVYTANNDRMEIKLDGESSEIRLGNFCLSIRALKLIAKEERFKIIEFLKNFDEDQRARFLTIQDYVGSNTEFLKMLAHDNAIELLEIWYDVFVICFDNHAATIPNQNIIRLSNFEIPIDILKQFTKEQRLNIIFTLKNLNDDQSSNFKKLLELVNDPEVYYKVLATEDAKKERFVASLNE